jgi:hypothetical protein
MMDIDRNMFLESIVGDVIFDRPVRIKAPGEFKGVPILIEVAFRRFTVFLLLPDLIVVYGTAGKLNQHGIDGNPFIDRQTLAGELLKDRVVDTGYGLFG